MAKMLVFLLDSQIESNKIVMTTFMHGRRVVLTDQHNNGDDKQARARLERIKRAYMGIQLPARSERLGGFHDPAWFRLETGPSLGVLR